MTNFWPETIGELKTVLEEITASGGVTDETFIRPITSDTDIWSPSNMQVYTQWNNGDRYLVIELS